MTEKMTELDPPPLKRLKFTRKELEDLSKEEIIEHWLEQDQYVDVLETRNSEGQKDSRELLSLRESEDKLRQQQLEATRRENLLVMRLAAKEQEMQEYASQIQDLKQSQTPGSAQLRSTLLDPAVNLMFESMKKELNATKAKLEETQNELSAWKFTPDSNTGKRLMAKCRLLYQENEELGKMISSGRMAKLEGDLALQKNFSEEMKKSQTELDEFLLELDEDVEGMQSTILYLQQQLKESKEQIARLQVEIQRIQTEQIHNLSPKSTLCCMDTRENESVTDSSVSTKNKFAKRNGNVNGPRIENEMNNIVNGTNCLTEKSNCDKTLHSPENEQMDVDQVWEENPKSLREKGPRSPDDEEEEKDGRDDCDSVESSYTPPPLVEGEKDEKEGKLCMSPLSEKRDSSEEMTGDEKMVNGSVSVSDDDV